MSQGVTTLLDIFGNGPVYRCVYSPGTCSDTRERTFVGQIQNRLGAAIADPNSTERDVAPLLRQEFGMLGAGGDRTTVPERFSHSLLENLGVLVGKSGLVSNVVPYRPRWLVGPVQSVEEAHAAGGPAQSAALQWNLVPSDPIVSEVLGRGMYRGAGQRDAVRAALRAPAGAVMAVVLPTGTGKTLVGLASGLAGSGTTVVIVPTVALALDQERQLRERAEDHDLPNELAYHGGLPQDTRDRIRQRIGEGTQRLVYCSPEAAVGSLSRALTDLARSGRLETLVIDECHLVNAWGETFRPEFQLLPGLRRMFLAAADENNAPGPVTILLTATMTSDTLETLVTLFDLPPDNLVEVQRLRPEPRYLLGSPKDDAERVDQLADLLGHVPRPAIVYVTRPPDAERLAVALRGRGFARLRVFHGGTPSGMREEALQAWAGPQPTADVMLATSAFGLGVDVPDVRTVVHACLPESIDRFYQEVGRGGRDGAPSLSVLMPILPDDENADSRAHFREDATADDDGDILDKDARTPDYDIARHLSRRKAIGDPKGANRWRTLRVGATLDDEELLVTDVRFRPFKLTDVGQAVIYDSPRNREWNWSTLNLLARSGAVRLRLRPPERLPKELEGDEKAVRGFFDEQNARVYLMPGLDREFPPFEGSREALEKGFSDTVQNVRNRMRTRADDSLSAMVAVARGRVCTTRMLSREYARQIKTMRGPIEQAPAGACHGCPNCGHLRVSPSPDVTAPQVDLFPIEPSPALRSILDGDGRAVILMPDEESGARQVRRDLLERLISVGIRHVVLLGDIPGMKESRLLNVAGSEGRSMTLARDFAIAMNPPVPTAVFLGEGRDLPESTLSPVTFPLVLLVPPDTRDPRDDRDFLVSETTACHYHGEVRL